MKQLHLDIETGDPDDLWTLALMATHPETNLLGVSVFPGGRDQIGLVKKVLRLVGHKDVPVGADVKDDGKHRVGMFYTNWLGKIDPSDPDFSITQLYDYMSRRAGTLQSLLTGGPLSNIKKVADYVHEKHDDNPQVIKLAYHTWTCQGGYVGSNVIADDDALEKFRGLDAVPTFNLNGDPRAAEALLDHSHNPFHHIRMVGKNVCHGFIMNKEDVLALPKGQHAGLDLMIDGMTFYCKKKPEGKAMHDILAALMHVAPQLGTWVEGVPRRRKGKWFFEAGIPSNIKALIAVDRQGVMEWL